MKTGHQNTLNGTPKHVKRDTKTRKRDTKTQRLCQSLPVSRNGWLLHELTVNTTVIQVMESPSANQTCPKSGIGWPLHKPHNMVYPGKAYSQPGNEPAPMCGYRLLALVAEHQVTSYERFCQSLSPLAGSRRESGGIAGHGCIAGKLRSFGDQSSVECQLG